MPLRRGAIIALATLLAACSDSNTKAQTDGGVDGDGAKVDQRVANTCLSECMAEAAFLCIKDATGDCIECETDAHCIGNPGALGSKCDSNNYCICDTDAACVGRAAGKKCDTQTGACSCLTDADCENGLRCTGDLGDFKICAEPCKGDGDCESKSAPQCNVQTGACVACLKDPDCTSKSTPYCNTQSGQCAQCLNASHCAANPSGTACSNGACGCTGETDCKHSAAWGDQCVEKSFLGTPYKECGCEGAANCSANDNGPTCFAQSKKCSCSGDADCQNQARPKCALPYDGADYSHCQAACSKDDDCKDLRGLPICDTNTGKCVACLTTKDCTGGQTCDTRKGQCVECLGDNDCSSAATPRCNPEGSCVECLAVADCAASLSGTVCGKDGACTCDTDADCRQSPDALGPTCITLQDSSKRCGCAAGQCSGNRNGEICNTDVQACSCTQDSDCKDSAYNKCGYPFAESPFRNCQKPCAGNADCKAEGLAICDSSVCVGCTQNSDCTYNPQQATCTAPFCVECTSDNDCKNNPSALGPSCDTQSGNYCICTSDAECAQNQNGKKCDALNAACGCEDDQDCPSGKTCSSSNYFGLAACK
jgi:hypothetical protein